MLRTVRLALSRGDKMCRERLHILSSSGDNLCRVRQNVPLRVHILSPATNCAGATKCAVTLILRHIWYHSMVYIFFQPMDLIIGLQYTVMMV